MMETAHLKPFSPTSLGKPSALSGLSAETIPRLETLREIEREVLEYRKAQEGRVKHCDELVQVVDELYSSLKDKERNRPKGLKKGQYRNLINILFLYFHFLFDFYRANDALA